MSMSQKGERGGKTVWYIIYNYCISAQFLFFFAAQQFQAFEVRHPYFGGSFILRISRNCRV